ncbi:hypothetical protein KJ665_01820, partial [Patescibacteria group bacterium]|nr:hypothetical protein [Patescibacteria group bacterium]
ALIYWTPRILSLLFIAFLSIFSLDVFEEYQGWGVIIPLFMHLLPALILLAVVILAWKYDLIGAVVFLSFAVLWVWQVGFDRPWSSYALIFGPAFLVSILFFLNWLIKRRNGLKSTEA